MVILLGVFASGCSGGLPIPTPISMVSYAVNGISLITTGKTVSDHALSAVMDQDCSMTRAFQGRLVCHDEGDNSDEERYEVLAAVHGRYSPATSPFEIEPADSADSVGEYDAVTIPPEPEPPPYFGPPGKQRVRSASVEPDVGDYSGDRPPD